MEDALKDCRYSVITEKNPREIVLLRGNGCKWKRCRFCDYHMDFSKNEQDNAILNSKCFIAGNRQIWLFRSN